MILTVSGLEEDTDVVNMMKKDATKRQVYIAPPNLINTRTLLMSWFLQDQNRDK